MVLRILLTTISLSPVVYVTTSRFEVKCESGWASKVVIKNAVKNTGDMRHRFHPCVGKIPWRREWLPTPVFFPGNVHGKAVLGATAYWVARVGDDLETKPPWLIHIVLSLKPKQHCKAIILQFEKNKQAKKNFLYKIKAKTQTELSFFLRKHSKFREFSCKGASPGGLQIETL